MFTWILVVVLVASGVAAIVAPVVWAPGPAIIVGAELGLTSFVVAAGLVILELRRRR